MVPIGPYDSPLPLCTERAYKYGAPTTKNGYESGYQRGCEIATSPSLPQGLVEETHSAAPLLHLCLIIYDSFPYRSPKRISKEIRGLLWSRGEASGGSKGLIVAMNRE